MEINNALGSIGGILTLLLGLMTIVVVCGPLRHRKMIEKSFCLAIGLSFVSAAVRRLMKHYEYLDYDGSLVMFAEVMLLAARLAAVSFSVVIVYSWIVRCRERKARLELPPLEIGR